MRTSENIYSTYYCCVDVCVGRGRVTHALCGDQRIDSRSQFSAYTMGSRDQTSVLRLNSGFHDKHFYPLSRGISFQNATSLKLR